MLSTQGYAAKTARLPCNPSYLSDETWGLMTC